jgi:transposase
VWKVQLTGFRCGLGGGSITHDAHFRMRTFATYVGADNPVRFIDAFVDGLDLAAAGFSRVEPKATGRPGYAPADLLKLYIYGYLNLVRSSRRREAQQVGSSGDSSSPGADS